MLTVLIAVIQPSYATKLTRTWIIELNCKCNIYNHISIITSKNICTWFILTINYNTIMLIADESCNTVEHFTEESIRCTKENISMIEIHQWTHCCRCIIRQFVICNIQWNSTLVYACINHVYINQNVQI